MTNLPLEPQERLALIQRVRKPLTVKLSFLLAIYVVLGFVGVLLFFAFGTDQAVEYLIQGLKLLVILFVVYLVVSIPEIVTLLAYLENKKISLELKTYQLIEDVYETTLVITTPVQTKLRLPLELFGQINPEEPLFIEYIGISREVLHVSQNRVVLV